MFQTARCSSSGGQIVSPQPLVSSPWKSVNDHILIKCGLLYCFKNPQHVSSSTLLILRRTKFITTASGIVTLEIGERSYINKMTCAVLLKQYSTRHFINI